MRRRTVVSSLAAGLVWTGGCVGGAREPVGESGPHLFVVDHSGYGDGATPPQADNPKPLSVFLNLTVTERTLGSAPTPVASAVNSPAMNTSARFASATIPGVADPDCQELSLI